METSTGLLKLKDGYVLNEEGRRKVLAITTTNLRQHFEQCWSRRNQKTPLSLFQKIGVKVSYKHLSVVLREKFGVDGVQAAAGNSQGNRATC